MMSVSNPERAEVLTQALPYIRQYSGKAVVVKYGGSAMVSEMLKHQVMQDIVLLSLIGIRVVLVHGGGPEITDLLAKVGKQTRFVDGLRVTDSETMEYVQMALAGKVNLGLVNMLQTYGGKAIGISGMDGRMIEANTLDPRLGQVGDIVSIDPAVMLDLIDSGYIPVVSSLGAGSDGTVYNINADTAASCIAGALGAECLFLMTHTAGILKDVSDPATLISRIDCEDAEALFSSGMISGGMVPKLQSGLHAIRLGVPKVFILDGRIPHSLLLELLTDEGAGTLITGG